MSAPRGSALAAYIVLSLTWGSSFFFIKISIAGLSAQQLVLARLVLGALALNLIMQVTRRKWPRDLGLVKHLAIVGFLLCVFPLLLFAAAAHYIPSGLSSIYNATTPLMTMAISAALLPQERMSLLKGSGILLGGVGIVVVLGPWHLAETLSTGPAQLACLLGTASYGLAFAYLRRNVSGKYQHDSITLATVQVTLSAGMMVLASPFFIAEKVELTGGIVASVVCLGVLASGIAYIWNTHIVQNWGATPASTVTYVSPLVGVALGILALHESLSWNQPVGAVVVVVGILISQGVIGRRTSAAPPLTPAPASTRTGA